jgi:very-short-patch-repair endonuclease
MPKKKETFGSPIEDQMADSMLLFNIPPPVRQYQFLDDRQFTADFAWPELKFILEIDGGIWKPKSGHTSGTGYTRDRERDALAMTHGWAVLRVTTEQVKSGEAIVWLKQALDIRLETMRALSRLHKN